MTEPTPRPTRSAPASLRSRSIRRARIASLLAAISLAAAPLAPATSAPMSAATTVSSDDEKLTGLSGGAKEISANPKSPRSAAALNADKLSCGTETAQDATDATYLNTVLTAKMEGAMTKYRVACGRAVVKAVEARGLDIRAAQIAISTIIVESVMENITYGDRDSIGLFQQRDLWGSFAERTNPTTTTNLFLDEMARIFPSSSWMLGSRGEVAADVQLPAAQYRHRYEDNMSDAVKITDRLWAGEPGIRTTVVGSSSPPSNTKALQHLLTAYGFPTTADGVYGSATTAAVKSFQTKYGVTVNGFAGPKTMTKMVGGTNVAVKENWPNTNTAKAAQQLLIKRGFITGTADGTFSATDVQAVKTAQAKYGIPVTGVVDHITWSWLFMA